MKLPYYVYIHIRLDTGTVFYVGKGQGKRAWLKCNRSIHWKNIANVKGYKAEIVLQNLTETEAFTKESELIKHYKSICQCEANISVGSPKGGPVGVKRSLETRQKSSRSKIGKPAWNKGIPTTEAQRQKSREVQIGLQAGEKHPMYGKTHSLDAREKISKAKKGTTWTKARRDAHNKRKEGYQNSPSTN